MKEETLLQIIAGKIALEDMTEEERQEAYNALRPYAKPAELIAQKQEQIKRATQKILDSAPQRVNAAVQQLVRGEGLYQKYFCNMVEVPKVLHAAFVERGELPVPTQDFYHLPVVAPTGMVTLWTKANDKVVKERKDAITKESIMAVEQEAKDFYEAAMAKIPEQVTKGNQLFKQLDAERKANEKLCEIIDKALASVEAPELKVQVEEE